MLKLAFLLSNGACLGFVPLTNHARAGASSASPGLSPRWHVLHLLPSCYKLFLVLLFSKLVYMFIGFLLLHFCKFLVEPEVLDEEQLSMQSVVAMPRRSQGIYMSPFPEIALPTSTSTASAVDRILIGSVQTGASARHCFGSKFAKWLNGPNSSSRADGSRCLFSPPLLLRLRGDRGEYLSRDCTVMVHRNSYVTTPL